MASHERDERNRAKVLAAAHAAASWGRARRATWTDEPLPVPEHVADGVAAAAPIAPLARPAHAGGLSAVDDNRQGVWSGTIQPQLGRWGPRAVAVALAAAAIAAALRYGPGLWQAASSSAARIAANAPRPSVATPPAAPAKATGAIHIVSTPSGARVLIDGTPQGVTPLTLDEIAPGRHTVVLQSPAGTIQRVVAVAPGTTAEVDESIFSGWVTVYAPFELTITENGRALRLDDRNEIMLPAGPHDLRLANRGLGFEQSQHVELKPGDRVSISIKPPQTSIAVTATEPAEVWVDGVRLGETPLAGAPIDLGTHELVVRRLAGGDRRLTIRATVQPVSVYVDFSKPPA